MKRRYYLAYGSNLNMQQMRMRCLMAKPVTGAVLEGYTLSFRGHVGAGVATIKPKKGGRVPCGLWLISPEDEAALDNYEGFPHCYHKEIVSVRFGEHKHITKALTYVLNDGHALAMPSRVYLQTIFDGYKDFGLDTSALVKALNPSVNAYVHYKLSD